MAPGSQSTFCGKVTLLATGAVLEVRVKCSSDPFLDIAVYLGTASISIDLPAGTTKTNIADGKQMQIDLGGGEPSFGDANFSQEEITLLHEQAVNLGVPLVCGVTLTASPVHLDANSPATSTLLATITGCSPIAGDLVTFTLGKNQACGSLKSSAAATDKSGQASVTYGASKSAGTCVITATETNTKQSALVSIDQTQILIQ